MESHTCGRHKRQGIHLCLRVCSLDASADPLWSFYLAASSPQVGRHITWVASPFSNIAMRWDCITINDEPVAESVFKKVEAHFLQLNEKENIKASEFELLTATAFQIFNDEKIDVGIVEVGMGGTLDATNILQNQAVSVISKIAHDHQAFLGNSLPGIAKHKAGILRPNVPYIINPRNEVQVVEAIEEVAKKVGAGPRIMTDTEALRKDLFGQQHWRKFSAKLLPFQQENATLAFLAIIEAMKSINAFGPGVQPVLQLRKLVRGIEDKPIPGRFQRVKVPAVFGTSQREVLVDGAHNQDAAHALEEYILTNLRRTSIGEGEDAKKMPKGGWPVTWVIAMSEGKDAIGVLKPLLRRHDKVVVTSFGPVDGMPWVKPMHPGDLLDAVKDLHPDIQGILMPDRNVHQALCAAKYLTKGETPIVLTGSLYLVGEFFRERELLAKNSDVFDINQMFREEDNRVERLLRREMQDAGLSNA